jgi:hypothetical protein
VPRFTNDELVDKALAALEEVYLRAKDEPIEPTPALRFLLAFLANEAQERWPFDTFWKEATTPAARNTLSVAFGRRQGLNAALNGMYLQVGRKRE